MKCRSMLAAALVMSASAAPVMRKPPMGFSSWNHFGMRPSAPLLLDTADAMAETGLLSSGYVYINTDDGWLDKNRTEGGKTGALHPSSYFSNETDGIAALASGLATKGFRFGIYLAAGETTCGNRAGTLYHEFQDAKQLADAGVRYLKYDDCGEANIQSYAKYHVMKDALAAAYANADVELDYYSYEPFQVYNSLAIEQMTWTATVGDLWRSGSDIRPQWKSIVNNMHSNNKWAPNGKPGHYNDADMLEIGNGDFTLAEQRSHFAIWCLMKSPLIIGADVRKLTEDSLAILKNEALIAVNQDDLGIQGTLRASYGYEGRGPTVPPAHVPAQELSTPRLAGSPYVGPCSFGAAADSQQWRIETLASGDTAIVSATDGTKFLARSTEQDDTSVVVTTCEGGAESCGDAILFDIGRANETVAQIRDPQDASSCLAYDGTTLHMEGCRVEEGDAVNATDCWINNCRFSSLTDQLFYLNGLGQLSLAWTNFQAPREQHGRPNMATNIPMCVVTEGGFQPANAPHPPPPAVNDSQPLQIWAGPLAGGDMVVVLLNIGDDDSAITAEWADIGWEGSETATAVNLFEGGSVSVTGGLSASVGTHDCAAFRLTPSKSSGSIALV